MQVFVVFWWKEKVTIVCNARWSWYHKQIGWTKCNFGPLALSITKNMDNIQVIPSKNVETVIHFQRVSTWINCETWICDLSCGRKVCMPAKSLDGWGEDERLDWWHLDAMEGALPCQQSFTPTSHPYTGSISCASDGFLGVPNPWWKSFMSDLRTI